MFTNPFPNAFGLDIGDLSIKVVQIRNVTHRPGKPAFRPITLRSTTMPHGLITNGEIQQPEQVRKYIKHVITGQKKQKPIRSRWLTASLPDVQGFLKLIDIEKDPEDIIEEDINHASKMHIPFGEEDYYLDWQLMPQTEEKESVAHVLLAAIPKQIADTYTYLFESLGLGVIAL